MVNKPAGEDFLLACADVRTTISKEEASRYSESSIILLAERIYGSEAELIVL